MDGRFVVPLVGLKGGCGKTTSAVFLAEAAARAGNNVVVIDADPQASTSKWWAKAKAKGDPMGFDLRQVRFDVNQTVTDVLRTATDEIRPNVVVIDTPPGVGDRDIVLDALTEATGCIFPLRASIVEVEELRPTLQLAAHARIPLIVLRTCVDLRMKDTRALVSVLEDRGILTFNTAIPYNAAILRAGAGRPLKLYGYQYVWEEIAEGDE